MDLSTVISLAKKNQKEASTQKKIGYSTTVRPPKKLEKKVNPDAVKAFLNRKKEMEKMELEENIKKKGKLQKLREEKRHTTKAKAMATRTKDNLKIYRGEDFLGHRKKEQEVPLSTEADMMHKAFMKKLTEHSKSNGVQHHSGGRSSDEAATDKNNRKIKKIKKKARAASHLDFKDLLNLAQEQSSKQTDRSSSSSDESTDEDSDVNERYEKERKRRKKLEAELRAMKSLKRKSSEVTQGGSALKIAKLNQSLSEESKQAKVKALMEKFNKKVSGKPPASSSSTSNSLDNRKNSNRSKSISTTGIKNPSVKPNKLLSYKEKDVKNPSSRNKPSNNILSKNSKKESSISTTVATLDRRKNGNPLKNGLSSKQKQSVINFPPAKSNGNISTLKQKSQNVLKKAPNPYAEIMQKAQSNIKTAPCTLRVENALVRTNYPGVAGTDPSRPNYEKVKVPSRARLEEYRRAARGNTGCHRRMQVLRDDSEDEYDSEMEGFIDDEDEGIEEGISSQIGAIFGYDKSKYGRESEYELSKMDASYKDIVREESRSLRLALQEDAREAKLLEEEEKRKNKRK